MSPLKLRFEQNKTGAIFAALEWKLITLKILYKATILNKYLFKRGNL